MGRELDRNSPGLKARLTRSMTHIEEGIYVAIAAILILSAIGILLSIVVDFVGWVIGDASLTILGLLDRLLLVLMLVEILHTVGISLREHVLASESFLTVGLIAAIRRVLVITAEQPHPTEEVSTEFQLLMMELGLLTLLILALVVAIYLLRKQQSPGGDQIEPGTEPGTYLLRRPDGSLNMLVSPEKQPPDSEVRKRQPRDER